MEILFDKSGYPSEDSLEKIEQMAYKSEEEVKAVLDSIGEAWEYDDYFIKINDDLYRISTGGWSGNESLIVAFKRNLYQHIWTKIFMVDGGHYIIAFGEVRENLKEQMFHFYRDFLERYEDGAVEL